MVVWFCVTHVLNIGIPSKGRLRKDVFKISGNDVEDTDERKMEDFCALGCSNTADACQEFENSATGKLALYLVFYFSSRYKNDLTQIVQDGACLAKPVTGCPFIASSIQLVDLLCQLLHIELKIIPDEPRRMKDRKMGIHHSEEGGEFVPMFFSNQEFLGVSKYIIDKWWAQQLWWDYTHYIHLA